MEALTIHEAAETTGWTPRMLRYIERIGLICHSHGDHRSDRITVWIAASSIVIGAIISCGCIWIVFLCVRNSEATQKQIPIVQYINDGFFGADYSNFNELLEKYIKKMTARGRG